jgi:hypothetical protein
LELKLSLTLRHILTQLSRMFHAKAQRREEDGSRGEAAPQFHTFCLQQSCGRRAASPLALDLRAFAPLREQKTASPR